MSRSFNTVVFSHGKESGPWGSKITAMAASVRDLGLRVESVDYRGIEARMRVQKLIEVGQSFEAPLVLVGSSLGGHVSAAAATQLPVRGLFLLAPAFYMPGFEQDTPRDVPVPTAIVHGWRDAIVPVDNSIQWAREHGSEIHIVDSDHRLQDQIEAICLLLRAFLNALG